MQILLSGVGRDSHPTGICRVAASHAKALLANRVANRVSLAIGSWQLQLFRRLLKPYVDRIELLIANIRNNSVARNFWYAVTLPQLAKAHGADVVHLSYPAPTFRRAFRSPVVVTVHDLYPYDIPENFGFPRYYLNRVILRQCLSSVDGIACVSYATRSRLEEIFPAATRQVPTVVTGNYIERLSGTPEPPQVLQGIGAEGFVLTVAQHRKNKNLDLLIRSFAELANREEFHGFLVIVGSEGPETTSLHRLNKALGVSTRVRFINSVLDNELRWLYANCSVFVVCSSVEGYCLPLVEAQAIGARIVCSDIAILRENGGAQCTYFSLAGDAVRGLISAIRICMYQPVTDKGPDLHLREARVVAEYSKLYSRVNIASRAQVCEITPNPDGAKVTVPEDILH